MKSIAIVAGGDSSEYDVSLKSAEGLYRFIDKNRYDLYIVLLTGGKWIVRMQDGSASDIDKNDFSFCTDGKKIKFDYAYITIHGRPGEDGRLQGYFDMLNIPYSSCGVLAGALTFNKFVNNQFLKSQGIRVPESILMKEGQEIAAIDVINELGLPVFVKPNEGGSSFGVTKVKDASQMQPAIEKALKEGGDVIIERLIEGTEVTCGCYKTKLKHVVFPVTEVVTDNDFFDFDAKYNGEVQEITPARISSELSEKIQQITSQIYDIINARGIIRIDYIIPGDNNPVLLDVNTNPGMTTTSFIPQQIHAAGLDIKDIMNEIIEESLCKKKLNI